MTHSSDYPDGTSYDQLPYYSFAFQDTHPAHLAAVGRLFNLRPPAVEQARVLELGCAAGGNLIPMALAYPQMHLVGVDYSRVQIQQGRETVADLDLEGRVSLKADSIVDLDESLGTFDYIICHGVYSWVPTEVQQAILDRTRRLLRDNGLAVISYNTYPGWKTREIARDAMLFHGNDMDASLIDRVAPARQLVATMRRLSETEDALHHSVMASLEEMLEDSEDYYFAHEFLESHNQPLYFSQFMAHAHPHGLRYVADTEVAIEFPDNFGQEAAMELVALSDDDQIRLSQYADFAVNRAFRRSILTPMDAAQGMDRQVDADVYQQLYYLVAECHETQVTDTEEPADFRCFEFSDGAWIGTTQPAEQCVLEAISELAGYVFSWQDLVERASRQYVEPIPESPLLHILERCVTEGFAVLWDTPPPTRPRLDSLARQPMLSAATRTFLQSNHHITNGLHHNYFLESWGQRLLPLLDGRHSRPQLKAILLADLEQGRLTCYEDEGQVIDPQTLAKQVEIFLDETLDHLRQYGFFFDPGS